MSNLKQLEEKFQSIRDDFQKAQGAHAETLKTLQKDFQLSSVEEAEAELEQLDAEIEKSKLDLERLQREIKKALEPSGEGD